MAFGNLKLFCLANGYSLNGIRGFTVAKMHAAKNAHPWLGCKGSDSIIIAKWLRFYTALCLLEDHWTEQDRKVLQWVIDGTSAGLAFSQGIHGHGIWLQPSCLAFLRKSVQTFGNCYALLANHAVGLGQSLYGCVPKLHAWMHFCADMHDSMLALSGLSRSSSKRLKETQRDASLSS